MRLTIIPSDNTVILDSVFVKLGVAGGTAMPESDPTWHALQFYEDGHLTIERQVGDPLLLTGSEATAAVASFVAAHAQEIARLADLVAASVTAGTNKRNYIAMIKRRAAALEAAGDTLGALLLLKSIGA